VKSKDSHKRHKYTLWTESRILNVKHGRKENSQYALKL